MDRSIHFAGTPAPPHPCRPPWTRSSRAHSLAKCADADGTPATKQTTGLLQRRHVRIDQIKYIGKRKREAKGQNSLPEPQAAPTLTRLCRDCGKPLKTGNQHCFDCAAKYSSARMSNTARVGRIKARGPEAGAKRAVTQKRHHAARSAWAETNDAPRMTKDAYLSQVQPAIRELPTRRIARELGVTVMYAGMIRKGYVPHPRHWLVLGRMVGITPTDPITRNKSAEGSIPLSSPKSIATQEGGRGVQCTALAVGI